MNAPWGVVVFVDIAGSVLTLGLAFCCMMLARDWTNKKPDDIFRHYIYLLTLAIVFFAISRSFGHLFKQILILNDMGNIWKQISPFSGAINSATFIVVFSFSIYFRHFKRVHLEIDKYKIHLEDMISERTAELGKANITLQNVLDSSNPICITDVDFNVIQANKAYLSIWPNTVNEVDKVKCYESRPGSNCGTDQCPMEQILNGKEEVIFDVTKELKGESCEFIVTARPFRDAEGKLSGVVESFQDISYRKKAEKALASEKERLAVTLRSIGDGVITTDMAGHVVLLNKVAERLTGWSNEMAAGRPLQEIFNIINEKTGEVCENPVEKVLSSGQIVGLANHTVLIARDGTERSIADSGAPILDSQSKIIGVVLVFRDVTEQIRTENELLKMKKLESIGLLAGGIAHDFNNILAAILGNINLALLDTGLSGKSKRLLGEAEKASLRAKDLTQQLLTFAKGGEPVKEAASLETVIKDSANFVLHGDMVACQYEIPEDLWLVDIDKGQVSQVIQNIVLNASHAMPEGGIIKIHCENLPSANIEIQPYVKSGRLVKISIEDSGVGIPPNLIDKIFDPYFTTKQAGSGLGLAITQSIISKHNGHITVISSLGRGTTFTIYLPASEKAQAEKNDTSAEAKMTSSARILVMDDDEMVREIAKEMLLQLGHEVVLAKNGTEAIQLYDDALNSDKTFDLAIMDLTIPGDRGGKEAVREVLARNPKAKVIASSGYSNDPIMANCQKYGFCASIIKPYLFQDLSKVINEILG